MDKPAELAYLLDAYGSLLSDRQRQLVKLRVDDDYTLTEIAENMGISKQGVHDAVTKAARYLETYEKQLGFVRYRLAASDAIRDALDALESGDAVRAADILNRFAEAYSVKEDGNGV